MSDPATQDQLPAASPPAPVAPTAPRSALMIVFLVVVIDLLGFGIVLPLLPRYAKDYVAPLLGATAGHWLVGLIVGVFMASFSAMQFVFAPIWGRISDRVGRRPILLIGLFGSVIFYALFGAASDLPANADWALLALVLIFLSRIGAGIAGATISTAQAVIADCTTPEKRKHGMALIGAAFGIGFTLGPLVGYASLQFGRQGAIGFAAAGLSALALVLGLLLLPETRRFDTAPPLDRRWFDWHAAREVLRSPALGPIVLIFFLSTLGFGGFESTLSVLIEEVLGLEKDQTFLIFAFVGLVLVLTQGGLYRRLAHRVSETSFMTAGLCFMAGGLLALAGVTWLGNQKTLENQKTVDFGTLLTCMLISLALAVVGFALLTPSAQALISRRADPAKQGEILGVNQSASALARILGPILGLTLFYLSASHLLPYFFGAGLLLLMLPLIPRIRRGG